MIIEVDLYEKIRIKRFDSFVYSRCLQETELTKQMAVEWTARKPRIQK